MPDNVLVFDLDIDNESIKELYGKYKSYRMIRGVPAILVYFYNPSRENWYVPDMVVNSSNICIITQMFDAVESKIKTLC